ncbi:amino acid ABC transporter permease [Spirochaetota bacterium]|nr:amino acid ABC transporter permease [Spirochaetota bacterium]
MSDFSKRINSIYNNTRVRVIFFQGATIAILVVIFASVIVNMFANMERRGIPVGFDFLSEEANFGILQTLIYYTETSNYVRVFWVGVINTAVVAVAGIFLVTVIGFTVGIARLSQSWLMVKLTIVYIEIFRNIPILLQILFWNSILRTVLPKPTEPLKLGSNMYLSIKSLVIPKLAPTPLFFVMLGLLVVLFVAIWYINRFSKNYLDRTGKTIPNITINLGLVGIYIVAVVVLFGNIFVIVDPVPSKFGYTGGSDIILEFIALTFALSFYHATYIAEQVRASIEAVDKGQKESALALGLKPSFVMRIVVLPQALRSTIPPLTNQYLNLTKNSSLATAIGYPDLVSVFAGTALNQTGRAVEIMFMTMAVYLMFSLTISVIMNWYNKRVKLVER